MFFSIKLRPILIFLAVVVLGVVLPSLFTVYVSRQVDARVEKVGFTIVIDAGHGEKDGGCVGTQTGQKESDINLSVAKKLQEYLQNVGFNVVMTRTTKSALCSDYEDNFKVTDMEKRAEIINKAQPNLVISIHSNSFPMPSEHGAQCYYQEGDEVAAKMATAIQNQLKNKLGDNARDFANHGDYYLLTSTIYPTVIVEGGFLTNPEEEALLITEEYQSKLAYAIMCGVFASFIQQ